MPATAAVAAQAAIATKDIVGWTVTGMVLGANLVWNYLNRRHTDRVAENLRQRNFDWDEWKGRRTSIAARLDDFEAAGDRLLALRRGDHDAGPLRHELASEGRALMMAHEALIRALDRSGGREWVHLAFGLTTGGETSWDLMNEILGAVSDHGDDAGAIRGSLAPIPQHIRDISAAITERIQSVTNQHYPG